MTFLFNAAAMWNLILLAALAILSWFFYWFGLRRLIRARKIAGVRDRRMLREAAERESEGEECENHRSWIPTEHNEKQVPPLRFAPVGMTNL